MKIDIHLDEAELLKIIVERYTAKGFDVHDCQIYSNGRDVAADLRMTADDIEVPAQVKRDTSCEF